MATTQNPITGRMSGTFANAVFSTQYSQNIMKAKPLSVRNPQSDLQKTQRALMKKAGELVKAINTFITDVFPASTYKMPAASHVVKHLLANSLTAVGEVVTVDYANLLPAPDALGLASGYSVVKNVADKVDVTWAGATLEAKTGADVEMIGLCYDVAADKFYRESTATLSSDETLNFAIPGTNTSKQFKIWILAKRKVARFKAGAELSSLV